MASEQIGTSEMIWMSCLRFHQENVAKLQLNLLVNYTGFIF